jgi:hypothetical protein
MMFNSLFEMTDTWYVEMAAGEQRHTFDIRITSERGPMIGHIGLFEFFDPSGHTVEAGPVQRSIEGHMLAADGLDVERSLILAFRAEAPRTVPVNFDFRIDGEPAVESTFFGETLRSPAKMPFALKAPRNTVQARTGPSRRPKPPYVLIWHCESDYKGETQVKLDEKTKHELRALGYIQ